uniref:Response regulator n=1 Tax=Archaeoglobus fulgidus TaxID=2234 RepID=A0A7J2TFU8_ARCFL
MYQVFLKDFRVLIAKNGEEAVRMFKFFKPDIVLMDISMPLMDGVEATREIMKINPSAIVIGVTAFSSQRGEELLRAGAKEIIRKPFNRKVLLEVIKKYADGLRKS